MSIPNEIETLRLQVEHLIAELQQSEHQREQMQMQLTSTQAECNEYKKMLLSLLPVEPFSFTDEELRDLKENGVTWDVIEKDLAEILERKS